MYVRVGAAVAAQLMLINAPVFAESAAPPPPKPVCSVQGGRAKSWTETFNLKITVSRNHPCGMGGYSATGAEIVSREVSSAKLGTVSPKGATGWTYQSNAAGSDQFTVTVRTTRGVWTHIYSVTVE
jgi:hypothetical protein